MTTYTTNLNLRKFAYDERGWGKGWRENLDILDAAIGRGYTPAGLDSDKPASPSVGDTYLATDTGIFYKCLSAGTWTETIAAAEIPDGGIDTDAIQDGAITATHLAAGAVTSDKIAAGVVDSAAIAAGAVDSAALAAAAVVAAKFASGAVGTTAIVDGAVGTDQLASNAITAAKLASGSVVATASAVLTPPTSLTLTSATYADITGLSTSITADDGLLVMFASVPLYTNTAYPPTWLDFAINGTRVSGYDGLAKVRGELYPQLAQIFWVTYVTAGTYTVSVQWRTGGGTYDEVYLDLNDYNEVQASLYVFNLKD